jgi:hypothetical protein
MANGLSAAAQRGKLARRQLGGKDKPKKKKKKKAKK